MIIKIIAILGFISFALYITLMYSRTKLDFIIFFSIFFTMIIINELVLSKYQHGILHELFIRKNK